MKKAAVKKSTRTSVKKATKKTAAKKTAAKSATKKRPGKSAKKPARKATAKAVKRPTKPSVKKTASKKPASNKTVNKPRAAPASTKKPAAPAKPAKPTPAQPKSSPAASAPEKKGSGRKGITIVSNRPAKRPRTKPKRKPLIIPGERLLGPGSPARKPLIPSGPTATPLQQIDSGDAAKPRKSPFGKRDLNKYRKLLLAKRAELLGDMEKIETDALRSESGDLSHFPQHMADQGSDSYEQSLSLDLAAADRRLIKEIDDALERISDGVYGLCQRTGKPINVARLSELPWARYSIEAAREIERRGRG